MVNNSWRNAIGYQIYLKSFFDSNNDGIGDLNGITKKLDYIRSLGVNFIWICPFYDSPMDDNGYDVRDYYKIDKIYGSHEDLKNLIEEAHKRKIKVVIDLVMNHTSDEHQWFVLSEENIEPYSDYYIWKNPIIKNGKRLPPNNWQSFFSGSAWGYSEKRKQYFLKIFSKKMPDLNYENEKVFEEMEKIISFYKDLNVDGFRVDAIAHIGKDLSFKNAKNIKKTYKSFSNRPNTHKYLKKFNEIFKKYNMITMGELGGEPTKKDIENYSTKNELDMIFSFEQTSVFNKNNTINLNKLFKCLKYKNQISENGGTPILFWLNHDYPRLKSKIKNEKDCFNSQICLAGLMYMLKGTPIIFNGEEIGMENYPYSKIDEFQDVNAKMFYENSTNKIDAIKYLQENSRDNSRTIMQWDDSKYAGFSSSLPWNFVNSNYKNINVSLQEKQQFSMLSFYKKLIKCRLDNINLINFGKYKFFKKNAILGYFIENNTSKIVIISNFGEKDYLLNFKNSIVLFSNKLGDGKILTPNELLILKLKENTMDKKLEELLSELKEITKKECYTMKLSTEKAKITDSKIGGNPYLPDGEEMPRMKNGDFMPLFVQINFDGIELENYPNKGILQLFLDKNADWPTEHAIRFYEDISKPSQTIFPEIPLESFFVQEETKLELTKEETYISIEDYRFSDLFCKLAKKYFKVDISGWMKIDDVTNVNIDDIFDNLLTDNGNIGGYANFTQEDPRNYDENLEDYTECLLKIDSQLDFNKIMIGDSGIAWLLIKKEDLINRRFENASFDWDCC